MDGLDVGDAVDNSDGLYEGADEIEGRALGLRLSSNTGMLVSEAPDDSGMLVSDVLPDDSGMLVSDVPSSEVDLVKEVVGSISVVNDVCSCIPSSTPDISCWWAAETDTGDSVSA